MRRRFGGSFWFAAILVAVFTLRAVTGIVGGIAYAKGSELAGQGDFRAALGYLDWASAPNDPAALSWLRGQVRQGIWGLIDEQSGRTARSDELLADAHQDYMRAISISPASGWYWSDLAEIYQQQETIERSEQPISLDMLDEDPWVRVGRPGRIAIGMCRIGIAREPNVYALHDRFATVLMENRLDALALDAVRESARIQPIFYLHPYRDLDPPPDGLLDAFAESSRAALGRTPLMTRAVHLTALGRIEIQRGRFEQAATDLREALARPAHRLNRAEANYYLGFALMMLERFEEAAEKLELSREHPNMETRALGALVSVAEATGDLDQALERLAKLRRAEPRNLAHVLQFARTARELERWDQAEDALKWARVTHPDDPRPLIELIKIYIDTGDLASARRVLIDLRRLDEDSAELRRLQARLDEARGAS